MKKLIPILLIILLILQITPSFAAEYEEPKVQLYFAPHIMNDITGEIVVDINLRNTSAALPAYLGEICALTFSFDYDEYNFNIGIKDADLVDFEVGGDKLIQKASDVETSFANGIVSFTFMDSTLADNLIGTDGTLASFKLYAKDVDALWNSFDAYPLRFVPGSVGVVTYHTPSSSVATLKNYEALDTMVGGYNKAQSFNPISVGKCITFTAGVAKVDVDGELKEIDATPYLLENGIMMVPVRYLTDSIGMQVEWDGEKMHAISQGDRKTLTVALGSGKVYINAVEVAPEVPPTEIDGRIYVPVSIIEDLYHGTEVTIDGGTAIVVVP